MTFRRHTAFIRLVVKGIRTDEVISFVQLESSENIIGTIDIPTVNNGDPILNATGKLANAYINKQSNGNNVVWFGLIPTDLSGKALTIRTYTDKATYEKTITPTSFNIQRAGVYKMSLTYGTENKNANQKTITFDFNTKPGTDWPTADAQYYLYCAKISGSTGLRVNYLTLTYTKP